MSELDDGIATLRDEIEQLLYDNGARIIEKNEAHSLKASLGICRGDGLYWITVEAAHMEID